MSYSAPNPYGPPPQPVVQPTSPPPAPGVPAGYVAMPAYMVTPPGPQKRTIAPIIVGVVLLGLWMLTALGLGGFALLVYGVVAVQANEMGNANLNILNNSLVWSIALTFFSLVGLVLSIMVGFAANKGKGLMTLIATTIVGLLLIASSALLWYSLSTVLAMGGGGEPANLAITFVVMLCLWLLPFAVTWGGLIYMLGDPIRKAEDRSEPVGVNA